MFFTAEDCTYAQIGREPNNPMTKTKKCTFQFVYSIIQLPQWPYPSSSSPRVRTLSSSSPSLWSLVKPLGSVAAREDPVVMNKLQVPASILPDQFSAYWKEQMISSYRKGEMLARQIKDNAVSLETYQWVKSYFCMSERNYKVIEELKLSLSCSIKYSHQLIETRMRDLKALSC